MMTNTISFSYERFPEKSDLKRLHDGITAHAKNQKRWMPTEGFAFFMRDQNKKLVGGCSGSVFYGSIYIDQLWVEKKFRRQGYGKEFIELAEALGKEKNCTFMTVNTMDWEGLAFYQSCGFSIEFERRGYAGDSVMYCLRKDFD